MSGLARAAIGPIEMFGRPGKMFTVRFGQRKWNCAPRQLAVERHRVAAARLMGPFWLESRPSVASAYASAETSSTSASCGCATWQW